MSLRIQEKRHSLRAPAAYPAILMDRKGKPLARGRTANISENGVFLLVNSCRAVNPGEYVLLGLTLPSISTRARPDAKRVVHYRCRVVHSRPLGHLVGIGVEFLTKIC